MIAFGYPYWWTRWWETWKLGVSGYAIFRTNPFVRGMTTSPLQVDGKLPAASFALAIWFPSFLDPQCPAIHIAWAQNRSQPTCGLWDFQTANVPRYGKNQGLEGAIALDSDGKASKCAYVCISVCIHIHIHVHIHVHIHMHIHLHVHVNVDIEYDIDILYTWLHTVFPFKTAMSCLPKRAWSRITATILQTSFMSHCMASAFTKSSTTAAASSPSKLCVMSTMTSLSWHEAKSALALVKWKKYFKAQPGIAQRLLPSTWKSYPTSKFQVQIHSNVVNPTINLPFGHGLYKPFIFLILGVVYYFA